MCESTIKDTQKAVLLSVFNVSQLVNLGKSITDFSVDGEEEAKKDEMEDDEDHEQLDEEMGKNRRKCFCPCFGILGSMVCV